MNFSLVKRLIDKDSFFYKLFIYGYTDVLNKAIPFLIFPFLVNWLTKNEFGVLNNFNVITAIAAPIISLSTSSYLVAEFHRPEVNKKSLYSNVIFVNIIFFLFTFLLVLLFSWEVEEYFSVKIGLQMIAIIFSFLSVFSELYFTQLRVEEKIKVFSNLSLLMAALGAITTFLFIYFFKMKMNGRVLSIFIVGLLGFFIAICKIWKYFDLKLINLLEFKNIVYFGLPLLPHNLSIWFKNGFEKLIITKDYGLSANADYSFALTLCSVFVIVSGSFYNTISPMAAKEFSQFHKMNDNIKERSVNNIVYKVHLFLLIFLVILVLSYLISIPIISKYFPNYSAALQFMPILLLVNFFNSCYIAVSMIIYFTKKTKWFGLLSISSTLVHIILLFLLLPIFNKFGIVYASLFSSIFTLIVFYFYSMSVFKMPWVNFWYIWNYRKSNFK
jgi:O-antigen/teichoic acid export membrane protein